MRRPVRSQLRCHLLSFVQRPFLHQGAHLRETRLLGEVPATQCARPRLLRWEAAGTPEVGPSPFPDTPNQGVEHTVSASLVSHLPVEPDRGDLTRIDFTPVLMSRP